jgi:two-component system, cell cycle sensor histidine kinase and response regulator CckA
VEDQEGLRMLAEEVLNAAGYTVLSAANGRAALNLVEENPDGIDLLITDVVMPEMSGPELADRLLRLRPGLIVLFMSGYTGDALLHRGAVENGTAFLQKPFLPAGLRMKVAELLGNREAPQG